MILYSVTVNIDEAIHDEWLEWMQNKHIPEIMATGLFLDNRMFRILSRLEGETGITYSMQYYLESIMEYEIYQANYAPHFQKEHADLFEGRYVAFRTLLEEVI